MDKSYLKNATIYQVFVRNHTSEGTFKALEGDLARIKDLGAAILYLLPIHPIGKLERKGTLGSPYSIEDYYAINPELGTLEDFKHFLDKAHSLGFKVMIDIVINHTSRDAKLVKEHPEYYYYKDGKLANRVGDWSDIADLRFDVAEVRDYLIEMLKYWTKFGVDGFRCDVAPLIPLSFWKKAVSACHQINEHLIWLSESVEPDFIKYLRSFKFTAHSDSEMYQAFDVLYDYDVYPFLKAYLKKDGDLKQYLKQVQAQEYIYPDNYLKIHFLENHDQSRIASLANNDLILRNLTAWSFFQNGVAFLYAGQEYKATVAPTLFDKQTLVNSNEDPAFYQFIKKLIEIKKMAYFSTVHRFDILDHLQLDLIVAKLESDAGVCYGLFNMTKYERSIYVPMEDGLYKDLLTNHLVTVSRGILKLKDPLFLIAVS